MSFNKELKMNPKAALTLVVLLSVFIVSSSLLVAYSLAQRPISYQVSDLTIINKTGDFEENWAALSNVSDTMVASCSYTGADGAPIFKVGLYTKDKCTQLTPDSPLEETMATWSPDGRTIAFEQHNREDKSSTVMLMDQDGTNIRPATDYSAKDRCIYAPRWTRDPNVLLVVIAYTNNCIPEPRSAHTQMALVRLDQGGKMYIIDNPPANLGWGYLSNPASSDDGNTIIFSVQVGQTVQIGQVSGVHADTLQWSQLTTDDINHYRPVFVPTYNDVFLFAGGKSNSRWDVYFYYHGRTYNLTEKSPGSCKDPDVRRLPKSIQFVATCASVTGGLSDFYTATLDIPVLPSLSPLQ